jgi:hypothetical protein
MSVRKEWWWAGAAALCVGLAATARAVIGLSTQFSDVVMENLKPGRSYNLRELRGLPYTVKNRGDGPAEVLVESVVPLPTERRTPYEPVPDPSWIRVTPNQYRLGPGEAGFSDIIITIPDDPSLIGRHFQSSVWAHTVGTGFMAAGVRSVLRFSVGKGPETLEEEARQKAMVDLDYDLYPPALYIVQAKVGKYDPKKVERKSLKLTNRSENALELNLKPVRWVGKFGNVPEGYEVPDDLSWVTLEPPTVKLEGETLKEIKVMLDVPEQYRGKKLAFLLELSLPIGTVVNVTNRVLVQVEK